MWARAIVGSKRYNYNSKPLQGNSTVWILFFISVASSIGLIIFFLRHRLLCRPMGEFSIKPSNIIQWYAI